MKFLSLRLAPKFNLVFIVVFSLSMAVAGWIFNALLQHHAREAVISHASLMMENALAVRRYTTKQIKPLLPAERNGRFVPQTVPAFSATQTFDLRENQRYRDYFYKEASQNPTNKRNKAAAWEAALIERFRKEPQRVEFIGVRATPRGEYLYLSRPIRVKDPACLQCHTTPAQAPAAQVRLYGTKGGFGWKLNDVVAAQVVSVPMTVPQHIARQITLLMLGALAVVLAITLLVLNVMLRIIVVQPVTRLSHAADEISKGNLEVEDLPVRGRDEIAGLSGSFNRMHRSLRQAIKMLDE